jgi:hypothetical protein
VNGQETGNREKLVFDEWREGTKEGVPPNAKINCFQEPETKYLNVRPEDQRRNPFKAPWDLPKVILNATRRSRGPWRISAFGDFRGLTCSEAFLAIWPKEPSLTSTIAAILNGPIANAFAATTREGARINQKSLLRFPMPRLSEPQRMAIDAAVKEYLDAISGSDWSSVDAILRRIDALVLRGYALPPRLERKVLDCFRGQKRPVPFEFEDYFPPDFELYFSLGDYLSPKFQAAKAGAVRDRFRKLPEHVLEAMKAAVESYKED